MLKELPQQHPLSQFYHPTIPICLCWTNFKQRLPASSKNCTSHRSVKFAGGGAPQTSRAYEKKGGRDRRLIFGLDRTPGLLWVFNLGGKEQKLEAPHPHPSRWTELPRWHLNIHHT